MSQLFASGGQSIGASVLSINIRVGTRISFRVDWFDLLSVQGTPKSLLQHHSSSLPDYRKSQSFDAMDLCQKSDVSAFQYAV